MNLAANLVCTTQQHPERPALRVGGQILTYWEFLARAQAAGGFLRDRGAMPGDRIGLMAPNILAYPIPFYGTLFAGCTVVPLNPLLTAHEAGYALSDAGARLLLVVEAVAATGEEVAERSGAAAVAVGLDGLSDAQLSGTTPLCDPAPREGDDTAVILYTSGTTGRPKGAELTHDNLSSNARTMATTLLEATPDDVIMGCLPLFHCFGLTCGLNAAVLSGASLALLPRFDPVQALEIIERHQVTIFEGVPTMYSALVHAPNAQEYDTSSLRTCVSGGAAMPPELLGTFEETFGATILEGYGLSETSPVASFNHPHRERKVGSIGTPVAGVRIRIVDPLGAEVTPGEIGELVIQGENVMKGYWQRPQETAEAIPDGWLRTGDLGRRDEDGYLYIVDRKKQLIIRGGYNVYPREVEEALYEHPAVAEVAVIGLKHSSLGEEVGAAVVLAPGKAATADELRAFAKQRVAAYKYPRHVWFVEELPKTATNKIMHRAIVAPSEIRVE
jgi:long-chain acyl-CoA synthetase